jgi:hypothetical protein
VLAVVSGIVADRVHRSRTGRGQQALHDQETGSAAPRAQAQRTASDDDVLRTVIAHLEAAARGETPAPAALTGMDDTLVAELLTTTVPALLTTFQDRERASGEVVVGLSQDWQSSAHHIEEIADGLIKKCPDNPVVLDAAMQIAHEAAQQARRTQTIAVLHGEPPGQQWPHDVALADVVRGAISRVSVYQRFTIGEDAPVLVAKAVVEPLIHLLAELLQNAAHMSRPTTQVLVVMKEARRGWIVEIIDDGLGMPTDQLDWARNRVKGHELVTLPDLGAPSQAGFAVVGTLARRHGFSVELTPSPFVGGIVATVLVPETHLIRSSSIPIPIPGPMNGRTREAPADTTTGQHPMSPQPDQDSAQPGADPADALPRRHRRPPLPPEEPTAPGTPAPAQSPEEAGKFMAAFLGAAPATTGPAESSGNHHDSYHHDNHDSATTWPAPGLDAPEDLR